MPRFYFDIDNTTLTADLVGEEHDDFAAATRAGMVILAEVALDEARHGRSSYGINVMIRDEHRRVGELRCRFWQASAAPA